MQTFLPGTDVLVTTNLVDSAGTALSPLAVEYAVFTEDGEELVARVAVPAYVAGESEVSVTVLAASNALDTGETVGLRQVIFYAQLETGWVAQEEIYKIATLDPLVVPDTSFTTYNEAVLIASGMTDMDGWNAASKEDRLGALTQARDNLCRITYSEATDLSEYTADDFADLDATFKWVLQKAQVVEADAILVGDEVSAKREGGLMSETIGESSMMFRPGRPAQYPVSKRAMKLLSRYIRPRMIGRA